MKYIAQYNEDYSSTLRHKVIEGPSYATWRELQQLFDPRYLYNNIIFFKVQEELKYKQGD
jgi:hypothetical protein